MSVEPISHDFIAERWWDYNASPTEKIPVRVGFTKPVVGTSRCKFWEAKFIIYWPDGKVIERATVGNDPVDALVRVIDLFRVECDKLKDAMGETVSFGSSTSLFSYLS